MTQNERIRKYFKDRPNTWIPAYTFAMEMGILQYNTRIKEIREDKDSPMNIVNRVSRVNGKTHSMFKYTPLVYDENGQLVMA